MPDYKLLERRYAKLTEALTGLPPHQEFLILNWRFVLKFYPLPQGEEVCRL